MKTRILLPLIVAAAACSGGEKDEPKTLTSGTYAWRDVESTDGCQWFDNLGFVNDVEVPLLVSTNSVKIDARVLTIDSNDETRFGGTFMQTIDYRPEYDCVEQDTDVIAGAITGENEAQVDVTITWIAVSGTGCNLANAPVTLPCTSEGTARLERLQPGS